MYGCIKGHLVLQTRRTWVEGHAIPHLFIECMHIECMNMFGIAENLTEYGPSNQLWGSNSSAIYGRNSGVGERRDRVWIGKCAN